MIQCWNRLHCKRKDAVLSCYDDDEDPRPGTSFQEEAAAVSFKRTFQSQELKLQARTNIESKELLYKRREFYERVMSFWCNFNVEEVGTSRFYLDVLEEDETSRGDREGSADALEDAGTSRRYREDSTGVSDDEPSSYAEESSGSCPDWNGDEAQMLSSDIVCAIKAVVQNAVGTIDDDDDDEQGRRRSSVDFIADDLLKELERAAKQVADMESEMELLKVRVWMSETRSSHLEETLAKLMEQHSFVDVDRSFRENSTVKRLAFLEEICRQKDVTILELEQEMSSLQCKISELLSFKEEQQRPVTITELLFKFGSNTGSRTARSAENVSSAKKRGACTKSLRSYNVIGRTPMTAIENIPS